MNLNKITKCAFLVVAFVALAIHSIYAQERITVKGTVTDDKNEPLIGVSVTTKSNQGAMSDINGQFSLPNVTKGEVLTFSYLGYTTQTQAAGANMNIQMTVDAVSLDAITVVAIGYGTMRKSDLTGAISSVSADDLKKGIITSTEQLLQGKVAGLTVIQGSGDPSKGSSMRLRGGTSLSASNGPLIVVDGISGVDINTIQPTEILSMDVLKDASATAIYGSRGANGVIIVTTNREKKGKTMEYNGYVAVGNVAKNMDLLSANQWRQYVRDNSLASAMDYGADTDWQKELQQTAISQSHTVSFSSGSESGGLRASINYLKNEGVIINSGLERLGGSLTAYQYGLDNKLKLEFSLHANADQWNLIDSDIFERAYTLNPTVPVMQNGKYTQIGGTNNNNPVELQQNRDEDNSRKRILGYAKAELDIWSGLRGIVDISYEYNSMQGRYYLPSYAFKGITDKGYGRRTQGDYTNAQIETYLTYDKQINPSNRIGLMRGYSYLDNTYEGFGSERRGFDTDKFLYNNLAAGQDYRAGDVYSYKGNAKLVSFFGRANYSLKDRYMVTATIRRDGSSRFGDNYKWGTFPSASVAWRASEESFMEGTRGWLDNLKVRAGYGVTGNQDGIGEYKSLSLLGTAAGSSYYDPSTGTWKQSYGPIQNPNQNLKWESTAQTNIGLDFTLFGRINATIDLYSKKTKDLLFTYQVPTPPYLFPTMLANVGDLSNKGIELTLGANIMKTKDFSWDANLTLAHNEQKVDRLSNEVYQTDVISSGSLHGLTGMSNTFTQIIKEGYPVGTFWGPRCTGIDADGKYILANNGEPEVLGDVQPDLTLGFAMNFTYRHFDMNISTYGMFGQKVLNATAMNISYPGRTPSYNVPDAFLKSGINDGPLYSSYWLEDASFFRLQNMTVGYTLPLHKCGFDRIRCYVTGENLFVITGYTGIDPEVGIDGLTTPGIDKSVATSSGDNVNYYPRPRTFSFGLNVYF